MIVGNNGAGKTNLLEGFYYLEIFRSFRGASDRQLIRFGEDAFHIRGRFEESSTGRTLEVAAAYEQSSRRKRITVDGVEPERIGDALGEVGIVVFSPSDVELVAGAPGERRRFLNIVLSLNAPGYLDALQRYRHVLKQRNQILRDGRGGGMLAAWDDGLVEWGSKVSATRARWIVRHAPGFARYFGAISGGDEGRLEYSPALPLSGATEAGGEEPSPGDSVESAPAALPTADAIAEIFRAELDRLAERERDRGVTLTGPHRDDFVCVAVRSGDAVDLRQFGSGGQQRTAAIALRLIEAETIRLRREREPIVLLDDIFAELDPDRSRRLLELVEAEERGQVILTVPKPSDVSVRGGTLDTWRIEAGRVEA